MKKNNLLIAVIGIVVIIFAAWYLMGSVGEGGKVTPQGNGESIAEVDPELAEYLALRQAECQANSGEWLSERQGCHIYDAEVADQLKLSCEEAEGEWLADSKYYECIIKGEKWQLGDWQMIQREIYDELKQSCLDKEGEWLGGTNQSCKLSGDVFEQGQWLALDEMQISCESEFKGKWLGGENMECKIDGLVYPGNWEQVFRLRDSCQLAGGTWLGGENNECQIANDVYQNQSWERLTEMRDSCESVGGVFKGGEKFRCDYEGKVYYNRSWERTAKSGDMAKACLTAAGTWDASLNACNGVDLDWCNEINSELDLGGLSYSETRSSCYIY